MTGALSPVHWLIILAVVLLLAGAKRLPDTARGLGQAMRIMKAETAAVPHNDRDPRVDNPTSPDHRVQTSGTENG